MINLLKIFNKKVSIEKYEYLISYSYDRGFGNAYITLEQKINSRAQLLKIAQMITKDGDFKDEIIILNFILLGVKNV